MKWPWQRDRTSDKDAEVLLAESHAAARAVAEDAAQHGPFRMTVEDVFTIRNRGTVATGRIESGSVGVGDRVRILRAGAEIASVEVTGVEMFRKVLDRAVAEDNVGLLLEGATKPDVVRSDVLES